MKKSHISESVVRGSAFWSDITSDIKSRLSSLSRATRKALVLPQVLLLIIISERVNKEFQGLDA